MQIFAFYVENISNFDIIWIKYLKYDHSDKLGKAR